MVIKAIWCWFCIWRTQKWQGPLLFLMKPFHCWHVRPIEPLAKNRLSFGSAWVKKGTQYAGPCFFNRECDFGSYSHVVNRGGDCRILIENVGWKIGKEKSSADDSWFLFFLIRMAIILQRWKQRSMDGWIDKCIEAWQDGSREAWMDGLMDA